MRQKSPPKHRYDAKRSMQLAVVDRQLLAKEETTLDPAAR